MLEVLLEYMRSGKVEVRSNSIVKGFVKKEDEKENGAEKDALGKIEAIELQNGELIYAKNFVLATGGKSHPETGSTGDGFVWLKALGHKVTEPSASLVPIAVENEWVKKLQGISLENVKITVLQNNQKQATEKHDFVYALWFDWPENFKYEQRHRRASQIRRGGNFAGHRAITGLWPAQSQAPRNFCRRK